MSAACVLRLLRISRTVSDLDRAVAFYRDALDFCVIDKVTHDDNAWRELMGIAGARGQSVTMRLGEQELELLAFDTAGDPYPSSSDSADLWFQHIAIVVSDIGAAYTRLCAYSLKPISERGPQRLPPTSGSVIAYKFRDPDGHPVELICFPVGTGNAIWQQKQGLFRGIDHSAIAVADMEHSIDFYTRLLGLRVSSHSTNSGSEQVRLDNALDVLVDIVALHPVIGGPPHVELLCYQWPVGRPIPKGAKSNDVISDRFIFQVQNLSQVIAMLKTENVAFISGRIVTLPDGQRGVQIEDPTGHHVILVETDRV